MATNYQSGPYLNKYLNGNYQSKIVMQKLARAFGMLPKVRHYVTQTELKNKCHALFEIHSRYGCQIGFNRIHNLQKIRLRTAKERFANHLFC